MQTRRSRRIAGAVAGVATLSAALLMVGTADADPITGTSGVTGSVRVKTNTFELPDGSAFTGTLDPDAGTIEGDVVIPDLVYNVTEPLATTATIQVTIPDGIAGTVAEDGTVSADGVARIEITNVAALGDLTGCVFAPVNLGLDGTYDAETGAVHLEDPQFTIPETGAGCSLAAVVNPLLAGEDNAMVLDIALGVPPSETTTTTSTSTTVAPTTTAAPGTPTPPPPAAAPIRGNAAYTG
jgi:cell division septation protein DedD